MAKSYLKFLGKIITMVKLLRLEGLQGVSELGGSKVL